MDYQERMMIKDKYQVIRELLKNIPEVVFEKCKLKHYRRGEIIFHRGDQIRHVYILCKGNVIISSDSINGNKMCVVFIKQGEFIGEMEAISNRDNLVYTAKAFTDCALLEIPLKVFNLWIEKDGHINRILVKILSDKLYQSSVATVEYKYLDSIMRLKMFLVEHGEGRILDTRDTLAEACGVSVRTINRCIGLLKEEGFISISKGKLVVSLKQLEDLQNSVLESN